MGVLCITNYSTINKEGAHSNFFQALAKSMVNSHTNWQEYEHGSPIVSNNHLESEIHDDESTSNTCLPLHQNNLTAKLSLKIKICQVCQCELKKT